MRFHSRQIGLAACALTLSTAPVWAAALSRVALLTDCVKPVANDETGKFSAIQKDFFNIADLNTEEKHAEYNQKALAILEARAPYPGNELLHFYVRVHEQASIGFFSNSVDEATCNAALDDLAPTFNVTYDQLIEALRGPAVYRADEAAVDKVFKLYLHATYFDFKKKAIEDLAYDENLHDLTQKHGLMPFDQAVIMSYTDYGFEVVNPPLRGGPGRPSLSEVQPYVDALKAAIAKLPDHVGLVKREACFPDAELAKHQPGKIVQYLAFTSASLKVGHSIDCATAELEMQSLTGKVLGPLSVHKNEAEVLFAPGAKFEITSRVDGESGLPLIKMRQVK